MPASTAHLQLDDLKLLLVEDNPGDERLIREALLESVPHHLDVVQSLAEALAQLTEKDDHDCVLLDLGLPDAAGLQALIEIQGENPDVPIVVLTGWDDEEMALQALQAGAQDYLTKASVSPDALGRAVRYARERKHLQGELLRVKLAAEQRFRGLVEQLPLVLYTTEPGAGGDWTYVSPGAGRLFELEPERWLASPGAWLALVAPEDRGRLQEAAAQLTLPGQAVSLEYKIVDGNGHSRWVHDEATVVLDTTSGSAVIQGVISDITARRLLEEQLQQAQKMEAVGQLAAGIAHDFNNLLFVILNSAEFIREELDPESPACRELQEVRQAAERGSALVKDMMALGRKQITTSQAVDIPKALKELVGLFPRALPADVSVIMNVPDTSFEVPLDRHQIEQVILNLVLNSVDAMPEGGEVRITATVDGAAQETLITVTDNGHGMDEPTKARIFEPFFTTKNRGSGNGTGLGLAMVYGIINSAGGSICARSEVGVGTSFELRLPLYQGMPRGASTSHPEERSTTRKLQVAVVDDEASIARVVERILRKAGHEVLRLEPADINTLTSVACSVDVLVTDVVMPHISGLKLANKMREQNPSLKVLFMSGYNEEALHGRGLSSDDILLSKPFQSVTLLEALDRLASP